MVLAACPRAPHQPGALEHLHVLRDGVERHVEGLGEAGYARGVLRQPLDDLSTRRVRGGDPCERPLANGPEEMLDGFRLETDADLTLIVERPVQRRGINSGARWLKRPSRPWRSRLPAPCDALAEESTSACHAMVSPDRGWS